MVPPPRFANNRAWVRALERAPYNQVIVGAIGLQLAITAVLFTWHRKSHKIAGTHTPEWHAMTQEYRKHNKSDPIFGIAKTQY